MLVLSRERMEAIWVGDDVRVTVLGISGGRVRLGIEAPEHIAIAREELVARNQFPKTDPGLGNVPPSRPSG